MGNGIFSDDGNMGTYYSENSTGGMFGGASLDFVTGRFSSLSLIAEQDGWGLNVGARAELRGVRFSVFAMEIGSSAEAGSGSYAGQRIAMSVGWQTNVLALIRGNRLESTAQRMAVRQGDLAREARDAQQRINALEGQLEALMAVSSQERAAERAELERRLKEEQDALKRLQEMMKAREAAARRPPDAEGGR
jgi:flagellar biosynthesis GTPase FlhF